METTVENAIISLSILEFIKQKGFTAGISKTVKTNSNGYPFITLLHATDKTAEGKTAATNFYFSKGAGALVAAGDIVDKEFLSQFQMSYVQCDAAAEGKAWKFTRMGESPNYNNPLSLFA